MTREFLKKLGISDENIDSIMSENGKDIEAAKGTVAATEQKLTAAATEVTGLKEQLAERDKDIAALKKQAGNNEELNNKIAELQAKYDTDTKTLTAKLEEQAYDHAADKFFDGFKFSSNAAKKAALADFRAKKLKLTDGKFEGADEFMAALKKDDPSAFAAEDDNKDGKNDNHQQQQQQQNPKPQFTRGTSQNQTGGGDNSIFNFGFTPVRTSKTNS